MRPFVLALCLVACGTATEPRTAPPPPPEEATAPGMNVTLDVRGRRIDVSADGVLHAEGCGAARFDWERMALVGESGDLNVAAPDLTVGPTGLDSRTDVTPVRRVAAPDGTVLVTIDAHEVRAGERPLFRIEDDGTLTDVGGGRTAISTSVPIPERHRLPVLALVALVGVCWETHPRPVTEP